VRAKSVLRLAAQVGKMYAFDWDAAHRCGHSIRGEHPYPRFVWARRLALPCSKCWPVFTPEDRATFMSSVAELTPERPDHPN